MTDKLGSYSQFKWACLLLSVTAAQAIAAPVVPDTLTDCRWHNFRDMQNLPLSWDQVYHLGSIDTSSMIVADSNSSSMTLVTDVPDARAKLEGQQALQDTEPAGLSGAASGPVSGQLPTSQPGIIPAPGNGYPGWAVSTYSDSSASDNSIDAIYTWSWFLANGSNPDQCEFETTWLQCLSRWINSDPNKTGPVRFCELTKSPPKKPDTLTDDQFLDLIFKQASVYEAQSDNCSAAQTFALMGTDLSPRNPRIRQGRMQQLKELSQGGFVMNYTMEMINYLTDYRRVGDATYDSEKETLRFMQLTLYAKYIPSVAIDSSGFLRYTTERKAVPGGFIGQMTLQDPPQPSDGVEALQKYLDATMPTHMSTELQFLLDRFHKDYPHSKYLSMLGIVDQRMDQYATAKGLNCAPMAAPKEQE